MLSTLIFPSKLLCQLWCDTLNTRALFFFSLIYRKLWLVNNHHCHSSRENVCPCIYACMFICMNYCQFHYKQKLHQALLSFRFVSFRYSLLSVCAFHHLSSLLMNSLDGETEVGIRNSCFMVATSHSLYNRRQ